MVKQMAAAGWLNKSYIRQFNFNSAKETKNT